MPLDRFNLWGPYLPDRSLADHRQLTSGERRDLLVLDTDVVQHLRTVNALAGQGKDMTDFDLAESVQPREVSAVKKIITAEPTTEEWVRLLAELHRLQNRLSGIPTPLFSAKDISDGRKDAMQALQIQFLVAKLRAFEEFYRRNLGEKINPEQYIKDTMGKEPLIAGENRIKIQTDRVTRRLQAVGFEYTAESIGAFRDSQMVDVEQAPQLLKAHGDKLLKKLSGFVGRKIEPKYTAGFDPIQPEIDAYWFNWSNGTRDNFRLTINKHPRHASKFNYGKLEAMAVHEILGHFGQMYGWQQAIGDGELLDSLGVTSVFGPEQPTCEGLAETLLYFVPDVYRELSQEAKIELELEGLRQMVYNNVHMAVNTPGVDHVEIVKYVQDHLPSETEAEIRHQIEERNLELNPVKGTYLSAYGTGFAIQQWAATAALNSEGRLRLLQIDMAQPTSPVQKIKIVDALSRDPRYASPDAVSLEEYLNPAPVAA